MGAKDVFTNPQFLSSMAGAGPGGVGGGGGGGNGGGGHGAGKSLCKEHKNSGRREEEDDEESIDEEWHQKYAFIIGLLRKPHAVLIKESLARERNKISQKLHAYRLERDYVQDLWSKAKIRSNNNVSDDDTEQSLGAQMKHLDMMCVTLQRQMDVLSNVDQALPRTENIYSGEPDSLDGTSSEMMMTDDLETSTAPHPFNNNNRINHNSNFQLIVNGPSPLDAYAMLNLERCAHRETRKELNMLRKKYEVLRDEFDSGEGLSHSTSLLFSRINGELEEEEEEAEEGMFSNNLTNDRNDISVETNDSTGGGRRLLTAAEVRIKEMTISQLRSTLEHLEKTRMMDKVPVDSAREIARLHSTLVQLERVRDELTLQNLTLKSKLAELSARITDSTTFRLEKHNNNNNKTNHNPLHSSQLIESGAAEAESTRNERSTIAGANKQDEEENKKNKKMELENEGGNPSDSSSSSSTCSASDQVSQPPSSSSSSSSPKSSGTIITDEMKLKRKSTYKVAHHNNTEANAEIKQLRAFINDLHAKEIEYQKRIADLETELRNLRNQQHPQSHGPIQSIPDHRHQTSQQQQQVAFKREPSAFVQRSLINSSGTNNHMNSQREEEGQALKLDLEKLSSENKRLKDDLNLLHTKMEKEQTESLEKLTRYEKEMGLILEQNKLLQEDFARERCLRKKYFNMVEELKGKIRVFCRIRPPSKTEKATDILVRRSDPYTVTVDTPAKGLKEFHFDRVFIQDDSQDQIFEDTKNLIKSAFDGYNVCICAYGQTGSGKTYTILGDELNPGIAPRTFQQIFSHANSMSQTYETQVSIYCLELYNDKLIDLLNPPPSSSSSSSSSSTSSSTTSSSTNNNNNDYVENKLEIRRDRKGIVWVSGARVISAVDSSSLEVHFRQALQSRHTASTKMNDRSSRSHLVVGLIVETTSKVNGTILRGKISLVDLAGSERTGKSGVSANTLREANAINKSLSAFGDVINALTTDQSFVPYRNNKLTLLMQDSIGGNAKTLMFVNISPSSFNLEETIISLSYASRVKQVTNSVTRNSESKEIARLKNIISRLKRGESSTATAEDDI